MLPHPTHFQIQLEKILQKKPQAHAQGPKKPALSQVETGKVK